jgi:hypothetical protein
MPTAGGATLDYVTSIIGEAAPAFAPGGACLIWGVAGC